MTPRLRPVRSLRAQFLLLISVLLVFTIAILLAATTWNARRGVMEQVEVDGKVLGSLIENAVVLASALPDDVERIVGDEMLATAVVISHYVALAREKGLTPEAINATLKRIAAQATVDEIWVTDAAGLSTINSSGDRFQFSPDPKITPQAAEFWQLLNGGAQSIVQKTLPRDIDRRLFKYVGTTGIDTPRIVQVGKSAEYMNSLRDLVGLDRLLQSLVADGYVRQLLVVDARLAPVAQASSDWRPLPPLDEVQQQELRRVMAEGGTRMRVATDAIELYVSIRETESVDDAFLARFSRSGLDRRLTEQTHWALAVGGLAFVVGALLSLAFARRLTNPLDTITQAATRVEAGDLADTPALDSISGRTDELGRLARVFQSMTHEIRNREQILDEQVRTRTQELAMKNADLEAARATIDDELELARKLQFSIVPAEFPLTPNCTGAARMRPATHMGGDFYDFIPLPDGRLGLVMADVAGKGVAAAFLMAVARTRLLGLAREYDDPAHCLGAANTMLCENNPLNLFITLFYGILDPRTGQLHYANGGHNPPCVLGADGAVRMLAAASGVALGIMPDLPYFTAVEQLRPGDLLMMYTDGVTEAFDADGNGYGEARLGALLSANTRAEPAAVVDAVVTDVDHHAGGALQSDDITVAALRWRPSH